MRQRGLHLSMLIAALAAFTLASCGEDEVAQSQLSAKASRSTALTSDQVVPPGAVCKGTGAHDQHAAKGISCKTCHACAGTLQFDASSAAVQPGGPAPTFDAVAKTCSNVGCHVVPAGTFDYYFPDGTGEPALNTVPYGGAAGAVPYWYAAGSSACTACHGNPPRAPGGGVYTWHSGYHGGQGPTGARNQCQLCHPDATSTAGVATGLVPAYASLHANGTVNVQATFSSACFGCH